MRERLSAPLGLERAATDAESAILFRAAVGRLPGAGPDDDPVPAPIWSLVMSAPESAAAMRAKEAEVPPPGLIGSHCGPGFELSDFPGGLIFEPKYGIHSRWSSPTTTAAGDPFTSTAAGPSIRRAD
jgi:hypothetical protein